MPENSVPENFFLAILYWLKQMEPLFFLLTVILMALYVYFTIKTFREIKRQTDLQSEAFLFIAAHSVAEITEGTELISEAKIISEKWRQILQTHVPEAIQNEDYLELEFNNRGNSDIIDWTIKINAIISPGKYLEKKYNIGGDAETWIHKSSGYDDNIAPNETIKVPIVNLSVFPSAEFSWGIEYSDTREINYERFAGDNNYKNTNVLANPKK